MKFLKNSIFIFLFVFSFLTIYYFFPEKKLDTSKPIDRIIVLKSKRKLQVWSGNIRLKNYTIALGRQPKGAKHFEGDDKTPEGIYKIDSKNPNSGYYKNLGISYPSDTDIKYAIQKGKKPGGLIKIHGVKNGKAYIGKFHKCFDWTHGCLALTNQEIDELYQNVKIGTIIEIKP